MNKFLQKLAKLFLGLSLATGVGVAIGANRKGAGQVDATDTMDVLTSSIFTATSTQYTSFSGVSETSDAVYAGKTAKSSGGGIQIRSKSSDTGIYTTGSGGNIKSISIVVESGSNTIDFYGKTSAYTGISDLYGSGSAQGTRIGSATGTGSVSLENPEDYTYLGIRSRSGACYITSISITWTSGTSQTLSSISLSGTYPTSFYTGDTFSHNGMVVTANYSPSGTDNVTSKATWSSPDMSTPGTKTVTVSYTEGGTTKTANYNITVTAKALTSITLSGTYPTSFYTGDTFSHSGMIVTANYNSGAQSVVTNSASWSSPDMSTAGQKTITVSYTDGEVTKTAEYTITVKSLNSIAVSTAPTKVTYLEGEYFDPTGLVISRTWSSGSPDTYTYAGHTSEFTFSPSTSTALTTSDTSVTITYKGKTTSQSITVNPIIAVTGISLDKNSTSVEQGSSDTLTATVTPSNATDKSVSWSVSPVDQGVSVSGGTISVAANATIGTYTVTATANGGDSVTTTCTVTVTKPTWTDVLELDGKTVYIETSSGGYYLPNTITDTNSRPSVGNLESAQAFDFILVGNNQYTIQAHGGTYDGKYLYANNSNGSSWRVQFSSTPQTWTGSKVSGSLLLQDGNSRYLTVYNNQDWRGYANRQSGAKDTLIFPEVVTDPAIKITSTFTYIKLTGDTSHSIEASVINPEQGEQYSLVYESLTDDVATVNSSTGAITTTGKGTATIRVSEANSKLDSTDYSFEVLSAHSGTTIGDALTLEEAYNFIDYLDSSELTGNYYVGGNVDHISGSDYYLDSEFEIYQATADTGVDLTEITAGVHIIGYGQLKLSGTTDYYMGNSPKIVAVGPPKLDSVTISGQTSTFIQGGAFLPGGTLTAHYTQGAADQMVTPTAYKYGPSGIDPTSAGTSISVNAPLDVTTHNGKYIYVLYTESNITKYCSFQITVNYTNIIDSVVLDRETAEIGFNTLFDTSVVDVTVSPSSANPSVVWSVASNTVGDDYTFEDGMLLSSDTEGTITLKCASTIDGEKYDTIVVTVIGDPTASFNDSSISGYPNHSKSIGFIYGNIDAEDVSKISVVSGDTNKVTVANDISINTTSNTGTVTINFVAVTQSPVTLSIRYDNGQPLSTVNVTVIEDTVSTVTWSEPEIDVFSGETLSTTGWNVRYTMASTDTGAADSYTIKLGSATVSAGYKFTAADDGKSLHVEYGGVSSSSVTISITQSINAVYADITTSHTKTWTATAAANLGSVISSVDGTDTGSVTFDDTTTMGYERTLEYVASGKADYMAFTENYIQFGSKNALEKLVLTASTTGTVKSVVVDCWSKDGGSDLTVTVGGNAFDTTKSTPSTGSEVTFTGSATGTVVITMEKTSKTSGLAQYIKSVSITTESSSGTTNIANNDSHKAAQRLVVEYANAFNAAIYNSGTSACTLDPESIDGEAAWSAASAAYTTFLTEAAKLGTTEEAYAKNLIKFATAQYSDDSGEACVERMLKTYEILVQRGYDDFMSDLVTVGARNVSPLVNIVGKNTNTVAILVIISMVSVTAIGGYFFLRKRKENI